MTPFFFKKNENLLFDKTCNINLPSIVFRTEACGLGLYYQPMCSLTCGGGMCFPKLQGCHVKIRLHSPVLEANSINHWHSDRYLCVCRCFSKLVSLSVAKHPLENISLVCRHYHRSWGLQHPPPCPALIDFEQGGTFIVPNLV